MNIELALKLASQQTHMDIIENMLLDLAAQLKTMRQEHEQLMTEIVEENR